MTSPLTMPAILRNTVARHPEREAIVYQDKRWTYAHWNRRVNRCADALADLGVGTGDRVVLFLHTGEAAATLYFACQKLAAVVVPLNFRLAQAEVAHVLGDAGAHVLAYDGALADTAMRAAADAGGVASMIVVEPQDEYPAGVHEYEALLHGRDDEEPQTAVEPQMLSALVYTSGTTGRPKGVIHTHANDVAIAFNCVAEYRLEAADRALHIAPLYHVGGMQAFLVPHLLVGAANVIEARYAAEAALRSIENERITTLFAVPTQIQQMLLHPAFPASDLSSVKMITTGGATLPGPMMERVLAEFCACLYNGYGMTEASLALLLEPRDAIRKPGSCGRATLISSTRIVRHDPTRAVAPDETVPVGKVGELIVRGPQVSTGYWNNPAATAQRMHHGWLYTGDLFLRDEDGYHYFQGRADDMIVSGGENIYPSEVEHVLHRCPGVQEATVIGSPDPSWGSVVTAFIVRRSPDLTAAAVSRFCRDSGLLAPFKRPRRIVFVDALPTNPSGKVLRAELATKAD